MAVISSGESDSIYSWLLDGQAAFDATIAGDSEGSVDPDRR
jgi:hypothetical protein